MIYNVFFHPLRHFPGPFARAASSLPHVVGVLRGDFEFKVLKLHERYGSVVRIAPNELSFTDGRAWNDIYGRHAKNRENPRDHSVHPPLDSVPGSMGETLLFADTKNHSYLRRIAGPAFNPTSVQKQEPHLHQLNNLFISQLAKAASRRVTVDLGLWFELLYSDHAGKLIFDDSFGCLESGTAHPIMHTIFHTIEPAVYASALHRFGLWKLINPLIPPQLKALERKLYTSAYAVADKRIARGVGAGSSDLLEHLMCQKGNKIWTDDGLRANGLHFIIAGAETVAFALTGIMWLLCTHPKSLEELQHELGSAISSDGDVDTAVLSTLPFLGAVIWEGLRLFPPGALNAPRLISHEHGQMVSGHFVPFNVSPLLLAQVKIITLRRRPVPSTITQLFVTAEILRGQTISSHIAGFRILQRNFKMISARLFSLSRSDPGTALLPSTYILDNMPVSRHELNMIGLRFWKCG